MILEIQHEINKIAQKYGFKDGILKQELDSLKTNILLHQQHLKSIVRLSKQKKIIDDLKTQTNSLLNCFNNAPTQIKSLINETPIYPNIQHDSWNIMQCYQDLEVLYKKCLFADEKLEADRGGRNPHSISVYVITLLAAIYNSGTGKKPTAGWNDPDNPSHSTFNYFVFDIKKILKKQGIKFCDDQTILVDTPQALSVYKKQLEPLEIS